MLYIPQACKRHAWRCLNKYSIRRYYYENNRRSHRKRQKPNSRSYNFPCSTQTCKEELHELEVYVEHHKEEIEAGDHHDPNALELFCDMHPDEPECLVYDD